METAEREALSSGKPVLVFRNCEPIPGNWICYKRKPDEDLDPLIIVNVVRDGKLVFRAWVSPGVGAEQTIGNVLRK